MNDLSIVASSAFVNPTSKIDAKVAIMKIRVAANHTQAALEILFLITRCSIRILPFSFFAKNIRVNKKPTVNVWESRYRNLLADKIRSTNLTLVIKLSSI